MQLSEAPKKEILQIARGHIDQLPATSDVAETVSQI